MNSLDHFLSHLKLWRCTRLGARINVLGSVYVVGGGSIEIGDDVVIDGRIVPVELHAGPCGQLIIGHGSVLEGGVSIEAQQRIEIGPGCRLRAFSKLMDNNFHPVAGSRHRRPASQPVKLEAGVEVGERCIVLPGAFLESRSTLGAGVVIARRVKSGMKVTAPKPQAPRAELISPPPADEEREVAEPTRLRTNRARTQSEPAAVAAS